MQMLRRRTMMASGGGGLPEGYTQKNMLVSNNAYVSLQLSLQYFTIVTSLIWNVINGNRLIGNSSSFFGINSNNGWRTNNTSQSQSFANMGIVNTDDVYNVTYSRVQGMTSLAVNGESGSVSSPAPSSTTLYLFNIRNDNTYRCDAKIGETYIYDQDNVLVSHLIPCIDPDNQSGVYDVVRYIFITHTNFTTI